MPDIFIGTDIVSVPRIANIISSSSGDKFIDRIFTDNEIRYCKNKEKSNIHFAGRFAAKEAITKALLSTDKISSVPMKSIEIVSGKNHKPEVNLNMDIDFKCNCKVSISHNDDSAIAFAIVEIDR